jgi:O-antigen ligase
MAMVSSTEESAYGRVDAWYQAYQMFKDNPFFGVGQGMFTDFHNLTAHNSFVLVMAELGILGLFFFTALFYFPYHWLWRNLFKVSDISLSPEDIGSVSAAFASLTSVLISMFFISRSYILLPFMSVAYVSVLTRIIGLDYAKTVSIPDKSRHIYIIIGLTILQIVLINIMVKTLI